ncbi:MAG: type II toxin-antitoxin system Phd/YefM family antitoxin [Clostridiales bacterium]|nr:type II toxin-antitoxin system Phd/YefM family antitoxin [Clostridiales bacterium]
MTIDANAIVTATEANQNFSRVAKIAEKKGHVVVFKNNRPKYLLIDLDTEPQIDMTEDERIEFVAARILREHKAAFEELAKQKNSPPTSPYAKAPD